MAARELNLPLFFLGVAVLGAGLGTGFYWFQAQREDERLDQVMAQQTMTVDPVNRQSVDITAPPPEALAGLPAYPGAVPKRVAETMKGQGSKMAVAWFTTQHSVDEVLAFYEVGFLKERRPYVQHRYGDRSGYIGWLQTDKPVRLDDEAGLKVFDGVMHLVSVLKEGQQTAVLLSASRPMALLDNPGLMPPNVELPPYAQGARVFDLGDGELKQTSIFGDITGHPLAEVEAWMRESLKQHGWKLADAASGPARTSLDFKQGTDHLSVVLTPSGANVGLMLQYANQPQSLTEGL